jgi:hypothetical protein
MERATGEGNESWVGFAPGVWWWVLGGGRGGGEGVFAKVCQGVCNATPTAPSRRNKD